MSVLPLVVAGAAAATVCQLWTSHNLGGRGNLPLGISDIAKIPPADLFSAGRPAAAAPRIAEDSPGDASVGPSQDTSTLIIIISIRPLQAAVQATYMKLLSST